MPAPPAVIAFPRFVDLPPDGAVVRRLRQIEGDLIVLSRLYPRAAYWLLRAHGVAGRFCPTWELSQFSSAENGTVPFGVAETVPSGSQRPIRCLDLRCFPDAAAIARSIAVAPGGGNPTFEQFEDDAAGLPRWHPVIDDDRCTNCLECLNFCLFGVYGLDAAGRILVETPAACRDGCPACWRICPVGAIIFPACDNPAIAGDDSPPLAFGDDLDRLADELDRSEEGSET